MIALLSSLLIFHSSVVVFDSSVVIFTSQFGCKFDSERDIFFTILIVKNCSN